MDKFLRYLGYQAYLSTITKFGDTWEAYDWASRLEVAGVLPLKLELIYRHPLKPRHYMKLITKVKLPDVDDPGQTTEIISNYPVVGDGTLTKENIKNTFLDIARKLYLHEVEEQITYLGEHVIFPHENNPFERWNEIS